MQVRDCVAFAAETLDLKNVVKYLKSGETNDYNNVSDTIETLLSAYNAVADEIARDFIKLTRSEVFTVTGGEIKFNKFSDNPLKIISVKGADGNAVAAKIYPDKIATDAGEITVEYVYAPAARELNDECDFSHTEIGARALGLGVAAEYALISGMYEQAVIYNEKFIDAMKNALFKRKKPKIKGRAWF